MVDGIVWLNGELTDFSSAKISLEDRGYEFGDGIYEVIRVYNQQPFALTEHLARLEDSAAGIELGLPLSAAEFAGLVHTLLERSEIPNAEVYIQVTRGAARRNHIFPENAKPTIVVGVRKSLETPRELWATGCRAVTLPDERWARCNLKTICLLPNVLAKNRARRAGAHEALLIRDGLLTEGTTCNVFLCHGHELITPVADNRILPGITRAVTIRIARDAGLNVIERDIKAEELFEAQEVFITSTSLELMPVVQIDDRRIGGGQPGDLNKNLHGMYCALTVPGALVRSY